MILYAKTDEIVCPNHEYKISSNTIAVRTLDLDKDFSELKKQSEEMKESFLVTCYIYAISSLKMSGYLYITERVIIWLQ